MIRHPRSDPGELTAFLILGLAGFAAILLAVFVNGGFLLALERAGKPLSAPPAAAGRGMAEFGPEVSATNRAALRPNTTTTDAVESNVKPGSKLSPDTARSPVPPSKPSV